MKKNIIYKIYLLLLGTVFGLNSAGAQTINLSEAVNIALENNEKVKQYEEKLAQEKYGNLEAWGNFLPTLSFEGKYNHLDSPLAIDLNPIKEVIVNLQAKNQVEFSNLGNLLQSGSPLGDQERAAIYSQSITGLNSAIPDFTETFKDQDNYSAAFTLVQPLFTGGKIIYAKKAASSLKQAAEMELRKTENEITVKTIKNYLTVILLKDVVRTREDVVDGVRKHVVNAEKLLNNGMIAKYQVMRARVALADAEVSLDEDTANLDLALLSLKNVLGMDDDEYLDVEDSLKYNSFDTEVNEFYAMALNYQPLLKIIDKKKEAADNKFKVERSDFLPNLAAFGKYETLPEYQSALEPRWAVGLSLNMAVFNGFKDYSQMQEAVHLKNELKYVEADAKRQIKLWVAKSYKEARNADSRYHKLTTSLDLAEENFKLNEKRFQTGYGTSLEVIDAQLALEKNRVEILSALNKYYTSLAELSLAAGEPNYFFDVWYDEGVNK